MNIERGLHLRLFNNTEKQLTQTLAEILLARTSFTHLLSVTAAVRDYVNQELFKEALLIIILRRDDAGMVMPMSPEFLPTNFASTAKQMLEDQSPETENPVVNVNWNEPPYQTFDQSEPEYPFGTSERTLRQILTISTGTYCSLTPAWTGEENSSSTCTGR